MAAWKVTNYRDTGGRQWVADLAHDGRIVLGGQRIDILFDYAAKYSQRGDTYQEEGMSHPIPIEQVWEQYEMQRNFYR